MRKCYVLIILICGCLCVGCSDVPPLQAASGADQTNILISDVVKRIKCELADSFDDKLANRQFQWLQNWTAKVDLTLQVNDTAGISPSVSYTKFYPNAFNFAAGSTSLTTHVIAAVTQSFTLTASAAYSEQAQRAETVTFTLSLHEVQTWHQQRDRFLRHRYGDAVADHFCDPSERELRGNLGLKEWIDSALYPVTRSELQAGIHPQAETATKPPGKPAAPTTTKEAIMIDIALAKPEIDAAAKAAAASANDAFQSQSAVAAFHNNVQTALQTNIAPYYSVLTDELKGIISKNQATLATIDDYVKKDADSAQEANDEVQNAAKVVDAPSPPKEVPQDLVTNAKLSAGVAARFAKDAKIQQNKASAIADALTTFKPNPPIDGLLHSVQFIVTYGGAVTPNWSLLLWKGPGLTVPGANLSGVRTNILNIALGPTTEQNRLILNQTITGSMHP